MTVPRRARSFILSAVYLLAYVTADKAAVLFEISPGLSLWYPPPGFMLALLVVGGLRRMPLALAGALTSAWLVYPMPHSWGTIAMATSLTLSYSGIAALLRGCFGRPPRIERLTDALGFALVLLCAAIPIAIVGTFVLQAEGLVARELFARSVFRWWLGDTAGILSVLPLLLVSIAPRVRGEVPLWRQRTAREYVEIAGQGAALAASLAIVYFWPPIRENFVPYLSFLPLTWIALRHGLAGAAPAIFAVNVGSVFVLKAAGASEPILISFLLFQFAVTAMGLGLGAMVSGRQRAEAEKNRLLEIVEVTPDFIGTAALDGTVLYCNTAFRTLRGDQPAGRIADFVPPAAAEKLFREAIPAALRDGRWSGESVVLDAAGHEVAVSQVIVPHRDDTGAPVALFTVARDISEQKRAEALRLESERKMLDAQKLESLGVLAGGIAHDFNNLLTAMLGNANLSRLELPPGSPVQHYLQQIENAALRAAELCQQMLAYSGKGQFEMSLVDLSTLVGDTAHLLQVSIPKKATLEFDLAKNLPPVRADATQLRQIAMNLVLNAAEAVGNSAGHIRVSTGLMQADAAWLAGGVVRPPPEPGTYIFVEVTDDGRGMTEEVCSRIFEPFFTTKFTGHGLGLSAVLGIVRGHRGTLKVESQVNRGTRFRVLLPAAAGEAAPSGSPAPAEPAWQGRGHLLLVDDEEPVRLVTARVLEQAGFSVETSVDGADAIQAFSRRPNRYRAVVLDMLMPHLDGEQTLAALRRLRADVPVLLMSGYTAGAQTLATQTGGPTACLPKPFQSAALLNELRTLIDRADATAA